VALYGCMYYGMLRPSEAVSLLLDECELPAAGWGRLEFREVRSAAGREWTDDGEVHEVRKPKGGPKNSVRRVPIPPELVRLMREHVESYGTAPDGRLFWTYRGGVYQPSTLWQVLRKARTAAFLLLSWHRRWPEGRTTSGTPGSRGGSMLAFLARRWPSGQVTAWRCSTGSMRTASRGTMGAGTSRWGTSLASLDGGHVCRNLVIPRAELAGCLPVHSAYIPGMATSGGFGGIRLHSRSASSGSFSQVSTGWAWL
jgi:hypothetical protein